MSIPPTVFLCPLAKPGRRGEWVPAVLVRRADSLLRLGEYVGTAGYEKRAQALEAANMYAAGWRLDFDRQHGEGFAEVAPLH